jgi:hypothetical protein
MRPDEPGQGDYGYDEVHAEVARQRRAAAPAGGGATGPAEPSAPGGDHGGDHGYDEVHDFRR